MSFNIVIVAQAGRLQFEAITFLASLRHSSPTFAGKVFVAEPQKGPNWDDDPSINNSDVRDLLRDLGAHFVQFESPHFGQSYPYGNKIECLNALPTGEPFVFLIPILWLQVI